MKTLFLALGLVLTVEGLVLALIPGRLDELVRRLAQIPIDTRRALGLGVLATGVVLIWAVGGIPT